MRKWRGEKLHYGGLGGIEVLFYQRSVCGSNVRSVRCKLHNIYTNCIYINARMTFISTCLTQMVFWKNCCFISIRLLWSCGSYRIDRMVELRTKICLFVFSYFVI
ncbi:unnamed protein product [Spodoptera littoralis]|uniref:Uncharacterized protein n=1 Tax=Spodoptera littoralis TaxID=7109 RepID=A0A9P0N1N8_SPOLI|nr:unnamed protein product [Spodoptera littoralis]CAH1638285.1 unnamed protein product [Spodoptera littoralis]